MSKKVSGVKAFNTVGVVLAMSGIMTACTIFPKPEAPRVMDFPVPASLQHDGNNRPQSLRIDTPTASEPYNSSRILAKPEPWEFRVYGGVRWRDTSPIILRDMLVGAFRAGSDFRDVSTDSSPASTDLTLATEITAFHAITQGDNTRATVAVYGQLIDNHSRATLCSKRFIASTPARDKRIEAVVKAFGSAGQKLAEEVIEWSETCDTRPD